MVPPDRRPPPRPGSGHDIPLDQQPEKRAVRHHPGVDGAPAPPPKRTQTLPGGIPAMVSPPLPPELRPTAPAAALQAPTLRATPAAGLPVVHVEDAAEGPPSASL